MEYIRKRSLEQIGPIPPLRRLIYKNIPKRKSLSLIKRGSEKRLKGYFILAYSAPLASSACRFLWLVLFAFVRTEWPRWWPEEHWNLKETGQDIFPTNEFFWISFAEFHFTELTPSHLQIIRKLPPVCAISTSTRCNVAADLRKRGSTERKILTRILLTIISYFDQKANLEHMI